MLVELSPAAEIVVEAELVEDHEVLSWSLRKNRFTGLLGAWGEEAPRRPIDIGTGLLQDRMLSGDAFGDTDRIDITELQTSSFAPSYQFAFGDALQSQFVQICLVHCFLVVRFAHGTGERALLKLGLSRLSTLK